MLGFSEKDLRSFNSQGRTLRPIINSITPTATPSYLNFLISYSLSFSSSLSPSTWLSSLINLIILDLMLSQRRWLLMRQNWSWMVDLLCHKPTHLVTLLGSILHITFFLNNSSYNLCTLYCLLIIIITCCKKINPFEYTDLDKNFFISNLDG